MRDARCVAHRCAERSAYAYTRVSGKKPLNGLEERSTREEWVPQAAQGEGAQGIAGQTPYIYVSGDGTPEHHGMGFRGAGVGELTAQGGSLSMCMERGGVGRLSLRGKH